MRISALSHNVGLREMVGCAPPQAGALQGCVCWQGCGDQPEAFASVPHVLAF